MIGMKRRNRVLGALAVIFAMLITSLPVNVLTAQAALSYNEISMTVSVGKTETYTTYFSLSKRGVPDPNKVLLADRTSDAADVVAYGDDYVTVKGIYPGQADFTFKYYDSDYPEYDGNTVMIVHVTVEGSSSGGSGNSGGGSSSKVTITDSNDFGETIYPATEYTYDSVRIHLTKTKVKLAVGKTKQIKLKKAKAKKVKWSVKNKKIATVKAGKITAKRPGTTVVTAKYKKKKYTCKVTVTTNVKLSKSSVTVRTKGTKSISLKNAKAKKVKWSVKNKKIASVKAGKITGKKNGNTVVTAAYQGKKYTCKVRVFSSKTLGTKKITQSNPTAKVGKVSVKMDSAFVKNGDRITVGEVSGTPDADGMSMTAYDFKLNGKSGELGGVTEIRLPYKGKSGTTPVAGNFNEATGKWETLPCYVDGKEIVILTDHFSIKGVTYYKTTEVFTDSDSVKAKLRQFISPEAPDLSDEVKAQGLAKAAARMMMGGVFKDEDMAAAISWYNTVFGFTTQGMDFGTKMFEGFNSKGSKWFSEYSDSFNRFGLALSAFDVIRYSYQGKGTEAFTTMAKMVATKGLDLWLAMLEESGSYVFGGVAKGIGAAVGFAVGVVDYALTSFGEEARSLRKESWAKAYYKYLEEEVNKNMRDDPDLEKVMDVKYGDVSVRSMVESKKLDKSKPAYWRVVLTPYFDGRYSQTAIYSKVTTLVDDYVNGFWTSGMTEIYFGKVSGMSSFIGGADSATMTGISEDYKAQLFGEGGAIKTAIDAILRQRQLEAEQGMDEAKARSIELTNELMTLHFYDSSYAASDDWSIFKGYTVRFKDIPSSIKNKKELECKLNNDGEGSIKLTYAGYFLHSLKNRFVLLDEDGKQVAEFTTLLDMPNTDIDLADNSNLVDKAAANRPGISDVFVQLEEKEQYTLSVTNAGDIGVSWASSDNSVVRVGTNGTSATITGVKAGVAVVKAVVKGKALYCTVDVIEKTQALPEDTIYVGDKITLSAENMTGGKSYWDNYLGVHGKDWKNSNGSVARMVVDNIGWSVQNTSKGPKLQYSDDYAATITGLKEGQTTITVTGYEPKYLDPHWDPPKIVGGRVSRSGSFTITVKKKPGNLKLSSTKLNITEGKTKKITLSGATGSVKWTSAKPSIASVSGSSGTATIKAIKAGKTTIKAEYEGKSYSCVVTVKKKASSGGSGGSSGGSDQKITKEVFVGSYDVEIGKSITLTPPVSGKAKWSTSNSKFATVTSSGKVTGRGQGACYIYADIGTTRYKWEIWAGSYED